MPPPPPPRVAVRNYLPATLVRDRPPVNSFSHSTMATIHTASSPQTVIIQAPPIILNTPAAAHGAAIPHPPGESSTSAQVPQGVIATPALAPPMNLSEQISSVKAKMDWACAELEKNSTIEANIQLCNLIKSCADALLSLHTLQHVPNAKPEKNSSESQEQSG